MKAKGVNPVGKSIVYSDGGKVSKKESHPIQRAYSDFIRSRQSDEIRSPQISESATGNSTSSRRVTTSAGRKGKKRG